MNQAQGQSEELNYFLGIEFLLIDGKAYEAYHEEVAISKATQTLKERCQYISTKFRKELSAIDMPQEILNRLDDKYLKRKLRQELGENNYELFREVKLAMAESEQKYILETINDSDKCEDTLRCGYMDSKYFHYKANITMPELWFIEPCYCLSYEFLTILKEDYPPFDDVLRMESEKHLIPVFLGYNTEIEPCDSDFPHSNFRLSELMINFLYRKLTDDSNKFEGVLKEDYTLFIELLERAKKEGHYLVLSFIGMGF